MTIARKNTIFIYGLTAVSLTLLFLSYLPTFSILHDYWSRSDLAYGHGYMVLAITVYLLFSTRNKIFLPERHLSTPFFLLSLLALLLTSLLWFSALSTQVQVIQLFAVIFIIWLWIAAVFGKQAAIHAAMPIFLLLLAIPLWEGLNIYLQDMTVYVTQFFLSLFGIVAYFEGNFIHLADGIIEVANTCSGYRYFLAGTALAITYAEMNIHTVQRKVCVIFLGIFMSILANWIRVTSLVVIGDVTQMQSSLVADHELFGWVIFLICFAAFLFLASKIDPGNKTVKLEKSGNTQGGHTTKFIDNYYFRAILATVIAVSSPVFNWAVTSNHAVNSLSHQLLLNSAIKIGAPEWLPGYSGFDKAQSWGVDIDGKQVNVSIISYLDQKQGKELIYYKNRLNNAGESIAETEQLNMPEGLTVNRSILIGQSQKRLVAWYFKVGRGDTVNEKMAKILQIPSIMQGVPIASLVTISATCLSDDCSQVKKQVLTPDLIEKVMQSIQVVKQTDNT